MSKRLPQALWFTWAVLLVVVVAGVLRFGTNILDREAAFDEKHIRVPIENLAEQGWSSETAIDFKETKGPTLIWIYAVIGGNVLGGELNDYRLLSVLLFIGGVVPLLLLCRQCGLEGPSLLLAAGMYVLLPHNAVLGQLLMSEPLFVFGALWLMWSFVWGFGTARESQHVVAGPIVFALILSALLHLRIHAAAFAAAAALVALERDRLRSWPWLLACTLAGLSRIPLWIRWGGPVAQEYGGMHGMGLNLDAVVYLAAAWAPYTAVFLLRAPGGARTVRWAFLGASAGLLLAVVATPHMNDMLRWGAMRLHRFAGMVATGIRMMTSSAGLQGLTVGALAVIGAGSMGALSALGWSWPVTDRRGVVVRLAVWMLIAGTGLYALTRAYVFDRYLLGWAILLPLVWVLVLNRKQLALQAIALLPILGWFVWQWLVRM